MRNSITTRVLTRGLLAAILGAAPLLAAPMLRLSNTTVGPVDIAVGANGPLQTVEAANAGDGALALTVSSPHPWLTPATGAPGACTSAQGVCVPIRISLDTAALARGIHTGTVTVGDPSALDAPQSITVTVQMGGGVPDEATLYVPPSGTDTLPFRTNSQLSFQTGTSSGGGWLSLALDGGGSFGFVLPYLISARDAGPLPEGSYDGTINVTASAFAPDVKQVPVTMQVTSAPIAALSAERIEFKLASDALAADQFIAVSNRGLGNLSINNVAATELPWLAAELTSGFIKITADPTAAVPGINDGSVTIETNAANSPHVVPVRLIVVAQTPPIASFQGVVNNATFAAGDPVPLGGIAAVFGEQLSTQPPATGSDLPLVRELGGTRVLVNGVEAPLFFSSRGQINFQVPFETQPGAAQVQVVREGQPGNTVTSEIRTANPRLLTFLGNFAIAQNTDETFAVPVTPGVPSRPARSGDTLVMYAIGFGQTVPPVPTGEAAPLQPLSNVTPTPTIFLGSGFLPLRVIPSFAGLTPNFVGLYQINFTIPANAPRGDRVPILLQGPGYTTNQVEIAIQ